MAVQILQQPFEPYALLLQHQGAADFAGRFGATASFVGTMRELNEGSAVSAMTLEHYPGMTERHLEQCIAAAEQRWQLLDALIVHRVGELLPNDPIVLVAVWSSHRADAFEACRFIMEELKTKAPFWKRERLASGGARWVEKNSPGTTGAAP